jgi:hypothetical protein
LKHSAYSGQREFRIYFSIGNGLELTKTVTSKGIPCSTTKLPAETEESRRLSRDLRKRGFRFVGPTICYAFMQPTGLVNDHTVDWFRRRAGGGGCRHPGHALRQKPKRKDSARMTTNRDM